MKKDKPGLAIIIAKKLKGQEDKPAGQYEDEKTELAEKMMAAESPEEYAKALQAFIKLCRM